MCTLLFGVILAYAVAYPNLAYIGLFSMIVGAAHVRSLNIFQLVLVWRWNRPWINFIMEVTVGFQSWCSGVFLLYARIHLRRVVKQIWSFRLYVEVWGDPNHRSNSRLCCYSWLVCSSEAISSVGVTVDFDASWLEYKTSLLLLR